MICKSFAMLLPWCDGAFNLHENLAHKLPVLCTEIKRNRLLCKHIQNHHLMRLLRVAPN
jgi:hypothetical protein